MTNEHYQPYDGEGTPSSDADFLTSLYLMHSILNYEGSTQTQRTVEDIRRVHARVMQKPWSELVTPESLRLVEETRGRPRRLDTMARQIEFGSKVRPGIGFGGKKPANKRPDNHKTIYLNNASQALTTQVLSQQGIRLGEY